MDGAAWKLPVEKILTTEEIVKVLTVAKKNNERHYRFFAIAANTGLRLCEVLHLKCEDYLGQGHLRITRRKKKVLAPEVIDVIPDVSEILEAIKAERKTGWLFPGGSGACVIVRRPQFKEVVCPDCNKQIADPALYKKSSDLKRLFFSHLTQEHKRDAEDVSLWLEHASIVKREKVCDGKHITKREVQHNWSMTLAEAGLYVPKRGIHSTRHAFAIDFYEKTGDLRATQMALGHANIATTTHYASVVDMKAKMSKLSRKIV